MSFLNESLTYPVPNISTAEPHELPCKDPIAATATEDEKLTEQPSDSASGDSRANVILVDFAENDPKNPLNWSRAHRWLIVFAVSWMGFVR